ncbi:hypothetical protein [Nocardioides humi]|uniref:DUF222 domain-containing protein n=1 Tax=Nocardioides humi TaxID=449461 RepID=A0ABN2BNW3_9ACTN|nr:hypothetical protein [Nocardioides humi]
MTTLAELSPAALLAAEEAGVRERRLAEVESAERLLAWCDLHSVDPRSQPGTPPVEHGGDRLVAVGGEGTPDVAELCFAEFAIAAHAGVIATTNRAADLLDLRHRLPRLHDATRQLRLDLWVARKVASMSRRLTRAQATLVDIAVAAAADESPSRILTIAEAKVIEADVEAHRRRVEDDVARTGVWVRRKRTGARVDPLIPEADVQAVTMRLSTAGAEALDETLDHLAGLLADQRAPTGGDDSTLDRLRARAAELLADPAAAARLLAGPDRADDVATARPRRKAVTIVVHLHQDVLAGACDGVARVDGIGPLLMEQVSALARGRDVTVLPVVDLNHGSAVNGYEHPVACRLRTLLRTSRDVFPHSSRLGVHRLDHDHATPYVPPDAGGPPGQTGDHNDAPLARREHRAKTHLGYRVRQLGLGAYRWETPHGLARVVTGSGTRPVELIRTSDGAAVGEIYGGRACLVTPGGGPPGVLAHDPQACACITCLTRV